MAAVRTLMDALQNKWGMERSGEVVCDTHAPNDVAASTGSMMAAIGCGTKPLLTVVSETLELSRTLEAFAAA